VQGIGVTGAGQLLGQLLPLLLAEVRSGQSLEDRQHRGTNGWRRRLGFCARAQGLLARSAARAAITVSGEIAGRSEIIVDFAEQRPCRIEKRVFLGPFEAEMFGVCQLFNTVSVGNPRDLVVQPVAQV
jgi:hypothetical protein